jgi:hypothetical protein
MLEIYTNKSIKINSIKDVIKLCENLIETGHNPIIVLDIDDTVLSSKIGQKFVESNIKILVDMIYTFNPNNLIFLTARDKNIIRHTINKLNSSGLLHKGTYINYNIISSPYDKYGNPTKGETLFDYFDKKTGKNILLNDKPNWIIFVDDLLEQIESVNLHINKLNVNYTLFHYKHIFFYFF